MEITHPGHARSAIAGKCNVPGGIGARGDGATWTKPSRIEVAAATESIEPWH